MKLTVLGATGSIGASTLDVVAAHPDRYSVYALSAHRSADAVLALCRVHRPRYAVLSGVSKQADLRRTFAEAGVELLIGAAALEQVATDAGCDAVMAGIVGAAGLASTLAAARAGKRVLLANKEALVMAGPLVMRSARESGAVILPVDSEHNAVFQCLSDVRSVLRITLTASGGPFRSLPLEKLRSIQQVTDNVETVIKQPIANGVKAPEGLDWTANLNRKSLEVLPDARLEPSLQNASVGSRYQFERMGYFVVDQDSTHGSLVVNRAVTLKDTWAKESKKTS